MKTLTGRRLLLFGLFTVVFLSILSLIYYWYRDNVVLTILMLTPAVSVVMTRVLTREGTKALFLTPGFRKNVRWYLLAYIATPFVAYAGALLFFALSHDSFDPLHSELAVQSGSTTMPVYLTQLMTTVPLAVVVNPILGFISCFGEEFAWRGYVLPKLCGFVSLPSAVLITGVAWGLWHAPIIAMGFNYGTSHPVLGIIAMIVLCVVLGTISAFLFFKSGSIWPGVLLHAAINGIDLWAPSNLFMSRAANPFIGPNLTGIVGGIGFIVIACFCIAWIRGNASSVRTSLLDNAGYKTEDIRQKPS